jgi:general nucleoside transport system ATP-binding protein
LTQTRLVLDRPLADEPSGQAVRPSTVQFDTISKRFGSIVANDAISCQFTTGGVHALLGENGAGKSTLMKILCGQYQPDSGRILLNDNQVWLKSSSQARELGIGMVHQQFTLVPSMTVLENVLLGDSRQPFLIDRKEQSHRLQKLAQKIGMQFDLAKPVAMLSVAERQKVEILKLLWRQANILILDEPTSQLAAFEAEDILSTAQQLAREGKIVILISHHIEEILRFSSRITVLRSAKHIATIDAHTIQANELARLIVDTISVPAAKPRQPITAVPHVSMRQVGVPPSAANRRMYSFDMDLFAGEVLGIAGVVGSGQEEVASILTGHLQPQSGTLQIDGEKAHWSKLRHAKTSGGYVPADARLSTVGSMSASENSMLRDLHQDEFVVGPFLKRKLIREKTVQRIKQFDVRPSHPDALCSSFSGGNLQRLVLARELNNPAKLFVAVNPTAGLDIAMTQRILQELQAAAASGKAVVLISPDLQELLNTCDRILVMCSGTLIGTEKVSDLDAESLGLLIGGVNIDIARKLAKYLRLDEDLAAEDFVKETLATLFRSERSWQRRLACQIAFRTFIGADLPAVQALIDSEENAECRAWLHLLSAKLGGREENETLLVEATTNRDSYLEVLRKIWKCEDLPELHAKLRAQTSGQVLKVESKLALILK